MATEYTLELIAWQIERVLVGLADMHDNNVVVTGNRRPCAHN